MLIFIIITNSLMIESRRLFINAKMKNEFYSKKIYPYYANQISIWDKMKWILAIILNKFVHKHVEV